jgi:hypothetical protein
MSLQRAQNVAPAPSNLLELPHPTKILPCGKCGTGVCVSANTVLAYCRECSAGLGVKK